MHKKWQNIEKSQKTLLQQIKNTKGVREFFSDLPVKGEMRDNISKKHVKLEECKSSTLRRYDKLLNKYYYLVKSPNERKVINDKLQEVRKELNTRPDAILKKEDN